MRVCMCPLSMQKRVRVCLYVCEREGESQFDGDVGQGRDRVLLGLLQHATEFRARCSYQHGCATSMGVCALLPIPCGAQGLVSCHLDACQLKGRLPISCLCRGRGRRT